MIPRLPPIGGARRESSRSPLAEVDVARDATGCYAKAGVYTQSNPSRGVSEAWGEVNVHDLEVTHVP